jgi:hypothetical protein
MAMLSGFFRSSSKGLKSGKPKNKLKKNRHLEKKIDPFMGGFPTPTHRPPSDRIAPSYGGTPHQSKNALGLDLGLPAPHARWDMPSSPFGSYSSKTTSSSTTVSSYTSTGFSRFTPTPNSSHSAFSSQTSLHLPYAKPNQVTHSIEYVPGKGVPSQNKPLPPVSTREEILANPAYQASMKPLREKAAQKMIVDLEGYKISNYIPDAIKQISQKTGLSNSEVSALFNKLYPGSV